MAKRSYSEIGGPDGLLATMQNFEGNSMSAQWLVDGTYCVWSYQTQIFGCNIRGEVTYDNERYYSKTTSHHQGLCRAWAGRQQRQLREA